jgi:hypothetical protein
MSRLFLPASLISVKMCSGNGVFTHICICDLGYTGPACQNENHTRMRDENASWIVTESIEASLSLAKILTDGGYSVSLIIPHDIKVGRDIARVLEESGIKLQRFVTNALTFARLESSGLEFGEASSMQVNSYATMRYLSETQPAAVVYFQTAGLGYYTLQAQDQGLLDLQSRLIVLVDDLPHLTVKQMVGERWMDDTESIKDEYLARRAAELAVCIILLLTRYLRKPLYWDQTFSSHPWCKKEGLMRFGRYRNQVRMS